MSGQPGEIDEAAPQATQLAGADAPGNKQVGMTPEQYDRWIKIYLPIEQERQRQLSLGYTPEHDVKRLGGAIRHLVYDVAAGYAQEVARLDRLHKDSQTPDHQFRRADQALKLAVVCITIYEYTRTSPELAEELKGMDY